MPKYLIQASYTAEGARGLLKEGAAARRKAVQQAVKSAGGKVESIYWAFGDVDTFLIIDMPDAVSAAGLALTVASSGAVQLSTTPLLSAEEIDEARKKKVDYRPPVD
jgi:uncharacterized protein with GYD domain